VGKNQFDEPLSVPSRWPLDRAEKPSLTSPRFRYCHFGLFAAKGYRLPLLGGYGSRRGGLMAFAVAYLSRGVPSR